MAESEVVRKEGKRKRNTPWAPEWKPIEESPQYQCGIITKFLNPKWAPKDYDLCKEAYNFDLHNFLNQVKETRGYDVDTGAPELVGSPFNDMYTNDQVKQYLKQPTTFLGKSIADEINFLLSKINAQAKRYRKVYEYRKVERLVKVSDHKCDLITFSVDEFELNKFAMKKKKNQQPVVKTIQAMVSVNLDFALHDVDKLVGSPFIDMYTKDQVTQYLKQPTTFLGKSIPGEINFLLSKINAEAKLYRRVYEYREVERLVKVSDHKCDFDLITFSVDEFELNKVAMKKKKKKKKNQKPVVKTIQAMVSVNLDFALRVWRFKNEVLKIKMLNVVYLLLLRLISSDLFVCFVSDFQWREITPTIIVI